MGLHFQGRGRALKNADEELVLIRPLRVYPRPMKNGNDVMSAVIGGNKPQIHKIF
jgi:hypothetical protein